MSIPTLLVIDEFYDRPDEVRQMVLSKEFQRFDTAMYPGTETQSPFNIRPVVGRISSYLCTPLEWSETKTRNGWFRIMKQDDPWKAKVHTDPFDYTAVIYMTPGGDSDGGTSFYRHKATGMTRLPYRLDPAYQQELRERDLTFQQMQDILVRDSNNDDAWEEIQSVAYRYNRLVIFEPSQFHTGRKLFGKNPESARMTQNFFLFIRR